MRRKYLLLAILAVLACSGRVQAGLEVPTLAVVAPATFARTLTAEERGAVYEELAQLQAFYLEALQGKVEFATSCVELARPVSAAEFTFARPGEVFLEPKAVEQDVAYAGVEGRKFSDVELYWAFDYHNALHLKPAYGGGSEGPGADVELFGQKGKAGFTSEPIFCWDKQYISLIAIHEQLHVLEAMCAARGLGGFLDPDWQAKFFPEVLKAGYKLPAGYTPESAQALAVRYQAEGKPLPWELQRLYYLWLLRRVPEGTWRGLAPQFGRWKEAGGAAFRVIPSCREYYLPEGRGCRLVVFAARGGKLVQGAEVTCLVRGRRRRLKQVVLTEREGRTQLAEYPAYELELSAKEVEGLQGPVEVEGRLQSGKQVVTAKAEAAFHVYSWQYVKAPGEISCVEGERAQVVAQVRGSGKARPGWLEFSAGGKSTRLEYEPALGAYRGVAPVLPGGVYVFEVKGAPEVLKAKGWLKVEPYCRVEVPPVVKTAAGHKVTLEVPFFTRGARARPERVRVQSTSAGVKAQATDWGVEVVLPGEWPAGRHEVEVEAEAEGHKAKAKIEVVSELKGRLACQVKGQGEGKRLVAEAFSSKGVRVEGKLLPKLEAWCEGKCYDFDGEEGLALEAKAGECEVVVFAPEVQLAPAEVVLKGYAPKSAPATGKRALVCSGYELSDDFETAWRQLKRLPGFDFGPGEAMQGPAPRGEGDFEAHYVLARSKGKLIVAGEVRDDALEDGDRCVLAIDGALDSVRGAYPSEQPAREQMQGDDCVIVFRPVAEGAKAAPVVLTRWSWAAAAGGKLECKREKGGYRFLASVPVKGTPLERVKAPALVGGYCYAVDCDKGEKATYYGFAPRWQFAAERAFQLWKSLPLLWVKGRP